MLKIILPFQIASTFQFVQFLTDALTGTSCFWKLSVAFHVSSNNIVFKLKKRLTGQKKNGKNQ
jgi:hypothetical protein